MCGFEKTTYTLCGHSFRRLVTYCHFARNDPFHQCFGVQTTKRVVVVTDQKCPECLF
ncbi:hypothetical protein FN846DRAFT_787803 [Sphaerosporella brunnea]|uniref:Uncharacterized protein n=1 Tax=Sphaerosporella brunnea TaxID=1250544 RepID=A0A5J5EEZ4_9PEZI|nr:hypothetical protein FN846DRAFT_787803 [Sphaerosporella brunnea]